MDILPYVFIGVVGLVSGVLSGISGGGGGMLMVPAYIFAGLPPQQAVATSKLNGLGAALGGLAAFFKSGHIRKDILRVMIPVAIAVGLVTPVLFSVIDSVAFQLALGIILILLTPTLFIKKKSIKPTTQKHKAAGYTTYGLILVLQVLFSSGVGSLALFVQTLLLGTTKIEANATKRAVTAVLTPITLVALLIGGYVSIIFGIVGMISVFVGTNIGSRVALSGGERFVSAAMATVIVVSGVALIVGALI